MKVTKHAIERYRERISGRVSPEQAKAKILKIARVGHPCHVTRSGFEDRRLGLACVRINPGKGSVVTVYRHGEYYEKADV